jgi:hypothetical protein
VVRFNGIEATILQAVGLQLCHESNTSSLLMLVNKNSASVL